MTKRIFKSICVAVAVVLASSLLIIAGVVYNYFYSIQQNQIRNETTLAARGISYAGMSFFDGLELNGHRITWIDSDGSVLYDSKSDASAMENHMDREEVLNALEYGYGESLRYSNTLTSRLFYSARRLPDGTVVRISGEHYSVIALVLSTLQPLLIIIAVAVVLSLVLAFRLSKNIVGPLNELNIDAPIVNSNYKEIQPLVDRINTQYIELRSQEDKLRQKREEFEILTDNMSEGIVLLNGRGRILSINHRASSVLDIRPSEGDSIYTVPCAQEIHHLVDSARGGISCETIIDVDSKRYKFSIEPIMAKGTVSGLVLVIFDVTEKELAEQIRREFSANVSHELKTPLHSISGYAELMKNGMAKNEDVPRFSDRIYTEAQRMIALVNDVLKLSKLDEGKNETEKTPVDLYNVSKSIIDELIPLAAQRDIKFSLSGENTVISGIPELIRAIIFNLCDNAIKYNRESGLIDISVGKTETEAFVSVKDTGIGIPKEHQDRIFERFYRVDKSHSKKIGGTGLGLSIVKHAAIIHGARIELDSSADKGTEIKVYFPL